MPFFKVPGTVNGIAPMRKFSKGGSVNPDRAPVWHQEPGLGGSMPFWVELDNLKDTDAPIHQPAAMLVAAD